MVQHEGYGAGFFVSDLLPPSALGLSGAPFWQGLIFIRLIHALSIVWAGFLSSLAGVGVRLVAVPGGAAHAGLLEMEMEAGGYGTVCGLNSQAANVACRQIGFEFGVVSPAGCAEYWGRKLLRRKRFPCCCKSLAVCRRRDELEGV